MILKVQTDFSARLIQKVHCGTKKSDSIETWEYPINVTVTINDGFEDEVCDNMFFKEHLEELDKYPVFL